MDDDKKTSSTNDDILDYLKNFKEQVAKDTKLLEKKVDKIEIQIEEKLNKMKRQMEENRTEGANMMEEITKRIDNLESEAFEKKIVTEKEKEVAKQKKRSEDRKKEELKRRRREEEKIKDNAKKEKTLQDELREASELEEKTTMIEEDTIEKDFEKEAVEWLNCHVKKKKTSLEIEDKKTKKKILGMKRLKNWFCDSDTEDEISSEEDEKAGEKEWEAIDRKEKNRRRKEKRRERDMKMKTDTATKASKIVGLGPIKKDTIKHFKNINGNLEKAKLAAVEEYLQYYLNYSNEEIKGIWRSRIPNLPRMTLFTWCSKTKVISEKYIAASHKVRMMI